MASYDITKEGKKTLKQYLDKVNRRVTRIAEQYGTDSDVYKDAEERLRQVVGKSDQYLNVNERTGAIQLSKSFITDINKIASEKGMRATHLVGSMYGKLDEVETVGEIRDEIIEEFNLDENTKLEDLRKYEKELVKRKYDMTNQIKDAFENIYTSIPNESGDSSVELKLLGIDKNKYADFLKRTEDMILKKGKSKQDLKTMLAMIDLVKKINDSTVDNVPIEFTEEEKNLLRFK